VTGERWFTFIAGWVSVGWWQLVLLQDHQFLGGFKGLEPSFKRNVPKSRGCGAFMRVPLSCLELSSHIQK
jgi:hypothetical protein